MPSNLAVALNLTGNDENGPIGPFSFPLILETQSAHEIIKKLVPAVGAPIVVDIPGFATPTLFLLKSDQAVGVQINAETALLPGAGVRPAIVMRTGGPAVATVTLTPNGTVAATVFIIVAGL